MAKQTKYCLLFLAGCLAVFSCSTDKEIGDGALRDSCLQEITVTKSPLALLASDADPGDDTPALPYGGEDIIDSEFTWGESMLYISQRTRYYNPFESPNVTYQYVYYDNPNANWNEGFNFQPYVAPDDNGDEINPNALNWETVGRNGSVGNGFALYAMYYPDQKNGTRTVAVDQSSLDSLKRSDILGAYHSTSALYSRVRFKLYHLMVYFKINLYVPVFGETWATDIADGQYKSQGFSGYTAASIIDAIVKNVCPRFTVDWAASISSDTSPSVGLNPSDNFTEDDLFDISMYSHAHEGDDIIDETQPGPEGILRSESLPENDEPAEEAASAIRPLKKTRVDISQFLPSDMIKIQPMDPDENGKIYDEVFMYSFSVIIPAQYSDFTLQNPGFLKFSFKRPTTESVKNYYFSSSFGNTGSLKPNKGTLQVLNLYLPRKGDEVILIGAEIQNWTDVDTDMTLPQQDPDKENKREEGQK